MYTGYVDIWGSSDPISLAQIFLSPKEPMQSLLGRQHRQVGIVSRTFFPEQESSSYYVNCTTTKTELLLTMRTLQRSCGWWPGGNERTSRSACNANIIPTSQLGLGTGRICLYVFFPFFFSDLSTWRESKKLELADTRLVGPTFIDSPTDAVARIMD